MRLVEEELECRMAVEGMLVVKEVQESLSENRRPGQAPMHLTTVKPIFYSFSKDYSTQTQFLLNHHCRTHCTSTFIQPILLDIQPHKMVKPIVGVSHQNPIP